MPRLRRVSTASPGWHRRRAGRGFAYSDASGGTLTTDQIQRVRSLAIPPAWRDVWICPYENGHLQATGVDAAGRRQYLYHPAWRVRRDAEKFARVLRAAAQLPSARERVAEDLALSGMPVARAAALAFRLLDLGAFRVGNDVYADAHGSFGLTTLERRHVRRDGEAMVFRFTGKSGIEHAITITDDAAIEAIEVMRGRRDGGTRLLVHRDDDAWTDLTSAAVNDYVADVMGGDFTAKDFRTWHATVLAATTLGLSEEEGSSVASRRRAVKAAISEVAEFLGNTPAVAKSSYVDPRVWDLYEAGTTIADAARGSYRSEDRRRAAVEAAVLELLAPST